MGSRNENGISSLVKGRGTACGGGIQTEVINNSEEATMVFTHLFTLHSYFKRIPQSAMPTAPFNKGAKCTANPKPNLITPRVTPWCLFYLGRIGKFLIFGENVRRSYLRHAVKLAGQVLFVGRLQSVEHDLTVFEGFGVGGNEKLRL